MFAFLAASLETHHAQSAHCSCSTCHPLSSHKSPWAGDCDHGKQHSTGSNDSCGNHQWAAGLVFFWWLFCSFSPHGQINTSTAEVGFCSRREGKEVRFPYSVLLVVGSVLLGPLNFRLSYYCLFTKLLICWNHPAEIAQPGCDGRAMPKNWIFPSKLLLCQCHLDALCCKETAGIHYCSVFQLPWEEIRRD